MSVKSQRAESDSFKRKNLGKYAALIMLTLKGVYMLDEYLKGYCKKHKVDEETAKSHSIVKEVAKYYEEAKKGKITETKIVVGCGSGKGGE